MLDRENRRGPWEECTDLVLTVDNAGAPAGNAAGSEVTKAAAETIAPVALAIGVEG